MRVIADLHIHSKYSRATSSSMEIPQIAEFARMKGLNLVGTGDFTHPKWLSELKEGLTEVDDTGLYWPTFDPTSPVRFVITTEVSTIFSLEGKIKKIHHVILTPSLETAIQINDRLSRWGDLSIDGRPVLNVDAASLVEEVMSVSAENEVIPAHAWTPWFSIFGAFSGVDRVEDCYQDMTKYIHALETGLSCYDEETEVLTENGWKFFNEVSKDDKIATLNRETGKLEYHYPLKVVYTRYRGEMYRQKSKSVDLLVTPTHKMWVKRRRGQEFEFIKAKDLPKIVSYKKNAIWEGEEKKFFILPSIKEDRHGNIIKERLLPTDDWLEFFGYYLSEGNVNNSDPHNYRIRLACYKRHLRNKMIDCVKRLGFKCWKEKNVITISNKQLYTYLRQFGYSKDRFIPRDILNLSKRQLTILFTSLMAGNGKLSKSWSYSTSSKRLADDFQELLLKIGYSGTICNSRGKEYTISINRKELTPQVNVGSKNDGRELVNYDGYVGCVTVPNHIIFVRRNGKPVWCGNSDPPMNWRLSFLGRFAFVSNSDSHSPLPHRIGREANVFELEEFSYSEIIDAIRRKDPNKFKFTIETDPAYGKYHWTGHRNCGVSLPPPEAIKLGNKCPKCGKRLTKGVEQRVEELADRPLGFKPEGAIPFMHLLPLLEIISTVKGAKQVVARESWKMYAKLVEKFGNEYSVLIDVPLEELLKVTDPEIAYVIIRVREGKVKVIPGYDGVYGKLSLYPEEVTRETPKPRKEKAQRMLEDFL